MSGIVATVTKNVVQQSPQQSPQQQVKQNAESLYRSSQKRTINPITTALKFQVVDWTSCNYTPDTEDGEADADAVVEEENDENAMPKKRKYIAPKFMIRAYGVNKHGDSVCLHIEDFTPYFFLKVPNNNNNNNNKWTEKNELSKFTSWLKRHKEFYRNAESLLKVDFVNRKDLYGFTDNKEFQFIRLVFRNKTAMFFCKKIFENVADIPLIRTISAQPLNFKVYEGNIDPMLRFTHIQDLLPFGWIMVNKGKYTVNTHKNKNAQTQCQLEARTKWENVIEYKSDTIAPLMVAAFDIEATSEDGSFPNPQRAGDKVIQIGTTVNRIPTKECFLKHMIALCPNMKANGEGICKPIDNTIVESYATEREVLIAWARLIRKLDPDIITGYNIWGFDFKFMYERAAHPLNDCLNEFLFLGRFTTKKSQLEEKKLASSALGQNVFYILDMEGRVQIDLLKVMQRDHKLDSYKLDNVAKIFMKDNKMDLSPKEIFANFKDGSSEKITEIAEYCLKDCVLCNDLMTKLNIVANNGGMANVCHIPLSYLFLRGQGVKIQSLTAYFCRKENILIPVVKKPEMRKENNRGDGEAEISGTDADDSYEGATVLEPKIGMYLDEVIGVLDYESLYPNSIISENISHDSLVVKDSEYDNLPNYNYNDITFDLFGKDAKGNKFKNGERTVRIAESKEKDADGNIKKNVIPRILQMLLKARKDTRAKIKNETDYFKQAVLDGLQLAYKVTANSLYGQLGAPTSAIFLKDLAAATTATGRKMLLTAKDIVEKTYTGAHIIYGDTDSIFINFDKHLLHKFGEERYNAMTNMEKLQETIELGKHSSKYVTSHLKRPQNLQYEKCLFPFCIFSKKRYIGNLYETNIHEYKQKSMGIVLKRRDNAPIVKDIYGGIIDTILNKRDVNSAKNFYYNAVKDLLEGKTPIEKLIISKSLRGDYKNPQGIAHKVLADRMGDRDPGNRPALSDRIPYVYIDLSQDPRFKKARSRKTDKILQGDKIEHPDYIKEHNLKPDYRYYLDHQICKPVNQIFELVMKDPDSIIRKLLIAYDNKMNKQQEITKWFVSPNTDNSTNNITNNSTNNSNNNTDNNSNNNSNNNTNTTLTITEMLEKEAADDDDNCEEDNDINNANNSNKNNSNKNNNKTSQTFGTKTKQITYDDFISPTQDTVLKLTGKCGKTNAQKAKQNKAAEKRKEAEKVREEKLLNKLKKIKETSETTKTKITNPKATKATKATTNATKATKTTKATTKTKTTNPKEI